MPSKPVGSLHRQIRGGVDREVSVRGRVRPNPNGLILYCQEKPLARDVATVPQTDTGGLVEHTKVDGRTHAKELGKLAP